MSQRKRKIHWSNLWNRFGCLPLLAAIAFGGLSLLLLSNRLSAQIGPMQLASASQGWPSTDGEIIDAGITGFRGASRTRQITSYDYFVEYRYRVGGQEYTGRRLHFSDRNDYFDTGQEAHAALGGLRRGDAVRVYYDPDAPANATLRRTYKLLIFDIAICLGIGAVAALLLYLTYRLLIAEPEPAARTSRLPP